MKVPKTPPNRTGVRANVLLMVLVMVGVSLTLVAAIFGYGSTNAKQNQRAADYYAAVSAAEAATEKLVAQITSDYRNYGDGYINLHLSQYATNVPNAAESSLWSNYDFLNTNGDVGNVDIQYYNVPGFSAVNGQYGPLKAWVDRYRVISNARLKSSRDAVVGSVYQDIELDRIPIFQYAVFFNTILEFTPMPAMDVNGPVHCNTNIYFNPYGTLTMWADVTSAGNIVMGPNPVGPLSNLGGTTIFKTPKHDSGVSTLNLPIGTNNSPAAVRQVLELPAIGENAGSSIGQQRYYNKADILILVSNTTMVVKAGPASGATNVFATNQYSSWLSTNKYFYNTREAKTVRTITIDVSKLVLWNASNSVIRPTLAARPNGIADVRIVYVYDGRTFTALNQSGVRLVNGDTLPPKGLTVATPFPLYIQGHYNCPVANRGTTNTSGTMPASVCADAVTVLSSAWLDTNAVNSSTTLSGRVAANTTVNSAILTGIVPTTSASDSGGVENFPRFLEEWTSKTLTYNGSMICMFYSQVATGLWVGIGDPPGIYNPPTRLWGLDLNFSDENKLPPGTPSVSILVRSRWRTPAAFTTNVIAGF